MLIIFKKWKLKRMPKFAISNSFSLVGNKMMINFAGSFNPHLFGENYPLNS